MFSSGALESFTTFVSSSFKSNTLCLSLVGDGDDREPPQLSGSADGTPGGSTTCRCCGREAPLRGLVWPGGGMDANEVMETEALCG